MSEVTTQEKIDQLKNLLQRKEWVEFAEEKTTEIAVIKDRLEGGLAKDAEKFSPHTMARKVIFFLRDLLDDGSKRLKKVNGHELVLGKVLDAVCAWERKLYTEDGLEFEDKYSDLDVDRKRLHILCCLTGDNGNYGYTAIPQALLEDLEAGLESEGLQVEQGEVLDGSAIELTVE